jgi:hypothetical protein
MARRTSVLPQIILILVLMMIVLLLFRNSHLLNSPERPHRTAREHHRREEYRPENPFEESRPYSSREKEQPENCSALGVARSSQYFAAWTAPSGRHTCRVRSKNGYPEPDPRCTPGGANPSVKLDTLRSPSWRTGCVRNCESTEAQKHIVYKWYGIAVPRDNHGESQVCELDHLVPLELGGADGLGNIWPQCGPDETTLDDRYFKVKDRVENYLADEVRSGKMPLNDAQRGIASDWTQYLDAANAYCRQSKKC